MKPHPPHTDSEWASYHELRWLVLRAPWNQPRGADAGEDKENEVHAMIAGPSGAALAVGRIIFKPNGEAQVRSMATDELHRGQGLGRCIIEYLEQEARRRGVTTISLNAREAAVPFYARLGYKPEAAGPLLFGCIRHVAMRKTL